MHVEVGAVSAASIGAFARFGRVVLEAAGPGAEVPSDAASAFDAYLDEWEALAVVHGDEEVVWTTDVDADLAEYLVYSFYRVTKAVNDEAGSAPVVPDDAAPFYWMLVGGLLDALAAEGGSRAEFAAHLRDFWPGETDVP